MEPINIDSKLLLTEADLQALGLGGRSTLRKYRLSGELIPLKLGKSIRYKRSDVEQFINSQTGAGHASE